MNPTRTLTCTLLLALIAGCSQQTPEPGEHHSVLQHITVQNDRVGAKAPGGDVAWIDADGGLLIDGTSVPLNDEQRAMTLQYHTQAMALRADGLAVGAAGVKLAGKAVSEVVRGLASGNPDQIGDRIQTDADGIEARARQLCERVGELQIAQDAIASQVPGFAPYATIRDHTAADCRGPI